MFRFFGLMLLTVLACLLPGLRGLVLCLCIDGEPSASIGMTCACEHVRLADAVQTDAAECLCQDQQFAPTSMWTLPGDPIPLLLVACVEYVAPRTILGDAYAVCRQWTPQQFPRPPPGDQTLAHLATVRLTI